MKHRSLFFCLPALLIMTMLFGILACIHVNIESVLLLIGQNPIIASLTAEYIAYFLPGLFFDFMFMTLARYLESQNLVRPMVMAACAGTVFTVLAQSLVFRWNLGLRASAGFLSISFGIMLLGEIIYIIRYRVYVETWNGESGFISSFSLKNLTFCSFHLYS
ncbi:unnamed protein product [Dibothriocephalus latus]|uniref:Uncharacterized protein n=1 Tax=Dibothriocephalus latus TaxID=60516 RepID=A0A3P6T439_DIBLA|nr:unnamed protein product [Dibothriocephalus latus]